MTSQNSQHPEDDWLSCSDTCPEDEFHGSAISIDSRFDSHLPLLFVDMPLDTTPPPISASKLVSLDFQSQEFGINESEDEDQGSTANLYDLLVVKENNDMETSTFADLYQCEASLSTCTGLRDGAILRSCVQADESVVIRYPEAVHYSSETRNSEGEFHVSVNFQSL
jgi:hypothetical protein